MGAALADLLPDFASLTPRAVSPAPEMQRQGSDPTVPGPAPVRVDDLVAAAVAKAEAEITERLSAVYEATLQAERENHAEELERVRNEFGTEAGQIVSSRLAEIETEIGALTSSLAARILGSVLTEDLRKRSLAVLTKAISEAMRDNDAVRIQVRGPQSLFEPLAQAMGDRSASVSYIEAPGFDLTVSIDGHLFESRLAEWSEALEGALS